MYILLRSGQRWDFAWGDALKITYWLIEATCSMLCHEFCPIFSATLHVRYATVRLVRAFRQRCVPSFKMMSVLQQALEERFCNELRDLFRIKVVRFQMQDSCT